jgi:hypothetical protein
MITLPDNYQEIIAETLRLAATVGRVAKAHPSGRYAPRRPGGSGVGYDRRHTQLTSAARSAKKWG